MRGRSQCQPENDERKGRVLIKVVTSPTIHMFYPGSSTTMCEHCASVPSFHTASIMHVLGFLPQHPHHTFQKSLMEPSHYISQVSQRKRQKWYGHHCNILQITRRTEFWRCWFPVIPFIHVILFQLQKWGKKSKYALWNGHVALFSLAFYYTEGLADALCLSSWSNTMFSKQALKSGDSVSAVISSRPDHSRSPFPSTFLCKHIFFCNMAMLMS